LRRLAAVTLLALALVPAAEAKIARSVGVNLDRDRRVERVQLVATTRPNHLGGTQPIPVRYVQVVDRVGGRLIRRRVSPRVEFATVKLRDFNLDGRPDIFFSGVSGNGGAAPQWFGLYDWTGRARRVLWSWSWRRSAVGRRWAGASVRRAERSRSHPGLELVLEEGVLSRGDANCCPSRLLVSVYGYSPRARRYRLIDRFYERPPTRDPF
jgi:hypothetical protein